MARRKDDGDCFLSLLLFITAVGWSKVMDEGRSLLGQMAGNGRTLTKVRGAGAD